MEKHFLFQGRKRALATPFTPSVRLTEADLLSTPESHMGINPPLIPSSNGWKWHVTDPRIRGSEKRRGSNKEGLDNDEDTGGSEDGDAAVTLSRHVLDNIYEPSHNH